MTVREYVCEEREKERKMMGRLPSREEARSEPHLAVARLERSARHPALIDHDPRASPAVSSAAAPPSAAAAATCHPRLFLSFKSVRTSANAHYTSVTNVS